MTTKNTSIQMAQTQSGKTDKKTKKSSALLKNRLKISIIVITLPSLLLASIGLFFFQKSTNAFNSTIEGIVTEVALVTELKDKIQQTVVPFNDFINQHQLDDKTRFVQLSNDIKKSLSNSIKFEQDKHSLSNDIYRSVYLNWRNAQRIANKIFGEIDQQKPYISYHLLQDFYQYVIATTLALDKLHLAIQDKVNIRFQKAKELKTNTLILIAFIFLLIYLTTVSNMLFFHRSIIKPINKLESWAKHFSRTKKIPSLTLQSYQEFEFIAETYNKLYRMLQDDQAILEQLSKKDELTQLHNRSAFLEQLKTEHIRHQRYYNPYIIMLVDIDHMTSINQNYGEHIGDLSLIHLSKILEESICPPDILSRYEQDKFVIILPEIDEYAANIIAEHILNSISEHVFKVNEFKFGITVSIGYSLVQKDNSLANNLKCVDFALQQAKQKGRNQAQYISALRYLPDNFQLNYFKRNDVKLFA